MTDRRGCGHDEIPPPLAGGGQGEGAVGRSPGASGAASPQPPSARGQLPTVKRGGVPSHARRLPSFALSLRLARRELRGGVRGLWIVLLCLGLGVAVIAAVGTLRAAIDRGLADDGRALLGGDLAIDTGYQPAPPALLAWLHARGGATSQVLQMRSMLVAPSGERQLIDLKAVDAAWPLVGAPTLQPAQPIAAALAQRDGHYGLLAEQVALDRLRLRVGDLVKLGNATFRISGVLVSEPDQVATPSLIGPRVLIAAAALPDTGLLAPGAMVRHRLRLITPQPVPTERLVRAIRTAFPDTGWRIRGPGDAAPAIAQFITQTSLFLTLVGLTSLLVGGIGVANGVHAWLDARARTIATLRCLGASSRMVFAVCLLQVMVLSAAGIAAGVLAGAALSLGGIVLFRDVLPVPPVLGVYPEPLLLAAAYGILTAATFSLWPLGRAARIPGAALFRDALLPQRTAPSRWLIGGTLLLGAGLIGLTIAAAADRFFALWFCAAALAGLLLFRLGGMALVRLARAAPRPRHAWARLGLANLHRPATPAPLAAALGRARPVHPGGGGADPGQRPPRRAGPTARRRSELLLRRYPEQPGGPLRPAGGQPARRAVAAPGAVAARPHCRGERRAG